MRGVAATIDDAFTRAPSTSPDATAERNRHLFGAVFQAELGRELFPAEIAVLRAFRTRWPAMRVLDVGVGLGRTTFTFAAVAERYVGIEYVSEFVAHCRQRFAGWEATEFAVADVRDLSTLAAGPFDLALFSFNGLDAVPERAMALAQLRAGVVPGGHVYFSTHSLRVLPHRMPRVRPRDLAPARLSETHRSLREGVMLVRRSRGVDLAAARARGYAVLTGPRGLTTSYVTDEFQRRQLAGLGLEVIWVRGDDGELIRGPLDEARTEALHYLCRAA